MTDPKEATSRIILRENLAIAIAMVTLVVQLGAWFWWGGKMEQRMTNIEQRVDDQAARLEAERDKRGKSDTEVAVIVTQYTEIIKRLDRIEHQNASHRR